MNKLLNTNEIKASRWPALLEETFGENLVSAFLHGNCLMEGFDALQAPWTVSLILKDNSPEQISKVQALTRTAAKENIAFCYFFSPAEIIKSLDTFPLEYLHIANRNVPLCGIQPLAGFEPRREHLRLQCERELRGILTHLRQEFANTKPGKELDKFYKGAKEEALPVLYGVYYLETGNYPDKHEQVFNQHPELEKQEFIQAISGIIKLVDSMEEK